MKCIRYNAFFVYVFSFFFLLHQGLLVAAFQQDETVSQDAPDVDLGIFEEDGNDTPDGVDADCSNLKRSVPPSIIYGYLNDLVPPINVILSDPFYFSTRPIQSKNIIFQPLFGPNRPTRMCSLWLPYETALYIDGFYNQTTHARLLNDDIFLDSYVNLGPSLLELIDTQELNFNVPDIIDLFRPLKVQERKIGCMFYTETALPHDLRLQVTLPLYWIERNFYPTEEETDRIKNAIDAAYKAAGFTPPVIDPMVFAKQHLIVDQFGPGDLRIALEKKLICTDKHEESVAFDLLLPTAFAIQKGLYGTYFDLEAPAPTFDFNQDFAQPAFDWLLNRDALAKERVIANASRFGTEILDRLSTVLLDSKLGEGHVGIGLWYKGSYALSPKTRALWYVGGMGFLPGNEHRFFAYDIQPDDIPLP